MRQRCVAATCPRWALPREEFPMHVKIPKELTPEIASARIRLDDSLEVRGLINMPGCERDGQTLLLPSLNTDSMADYDYFGVAVATSGPFTELKREVPMLVELVRRDGSVQAVEGRARIFRPRLRVGRAPGEIAVRDGGLGALRLPVRLVYDGFGDVRASVRCAVRGPAAPGGAPMQGGSPEAGGSGAARAGPEHAEQAMPDPGAGPGGGGGGGGGPRGARGRPAAAARTTAAERTAQALSGVLARNPSDRVRMEPASIRARTGPAGARVALRLTYEDLAGNRYGPLEWAVDIVDRRTSPSATDVEIPLAVTVDDSGAFRNVAGMEIGAGG